MAYRRWLSTLAFEHPAQQITFQDYVDAVMDAERRLQRVEEQIFNFLPEWNQRPVVDAPQAMRGIALINAGVLSGNGSRKWMGSMLLMCAHIDSLFHLPNIQ